MPQARLVRRYDFSSWGYRRRIPPPSLPPHPQTRGDFSWGREDSSTPASIPRALLGAIARSLPACCAKKVFGRMMWIFRVLALSCVACPMFVFADIPPALSDLVTNLDQDNFQTFAKSHPMVGSLAAFISCSCACPHEIQLRSHLLNRRMPPFRICLVCACLFGRSFLPRRAQRLSACGSNIA